MITLISFYTLLTSITFAFLTILLREDFRASQPNFWRKTIFWSILWPLFWLLAAIILLTDFFTPHRH